MESWQAGGEEVSPLRVTVLAELRKAADGAHSLQECVTWRQHVHRERALHRHRRLQTTTARTITTHQQNYSLITPLGTGVGRTVQTGKPET